MKPNLRIAINAQIPLGSGGGGIETVLRVLTSLGQLDGDEEYVFIGHWSDPNWLKPLLNERQKLVSPPKPEGRKTLISENFRQSLGQFRPILRKIKRAFRPPSAQIPIDLLPVSDGFYESLGCHVIHFPYQDFVRCKMPSVYNPHDLQHLHYPQFFTREEISRRETIYPAACRAAQTIVVASQFVKQDVVQSYGIKPDKVQTIPWSPPQISLKENAEKDWLSLKEKYNFFAEPFALYPAMTWEHKNHLRLLEAVARLRDRDKLRIHVICTGHKNSFFTQIEKRLRELKLKDQFRFPGIVTHEELRSLYFQAEFVIIPTLFEAASGPLFEAWQHNVAVACSSVTSLPEQAADAALLFDPFSVEEMADALKRMTRDENLRQSLRVKGAKRLLDFSLERTAKSYRAVYRKIAGLKLNDEDRDLLKA